MITINHIGLTLFLFLLMSNGIKNLDKVIYIILSIVIVYYISNHIKLDNLVNVDYNINKLLKKIDNYDKINKNLIKNDLKRLNNLSKIEYVSKSNKMSNMLFLKERINNHCDALYLNYSNNEDINDLINSINFFIKTNYKI
tara:strand:- start:276 stop:698 length:423 start_codon:yes stop_codon:yes gene_type:complete